MTPTQMLITTSPPLDGAVVVPSGFESRSSQTAVSNESP